VPALEMHQRGGKPSGFGRNRLGEARRLSAASRGLSFARRVAAELSRRPSATFRCDALTGRYWVESRCGAAVVG